MIPFRKIVEGGHMKKSERINDLMIYLNGKNTFNLKDIINKYQISKSTALRDIQSLEAIGMPIYSELGRNGYYGILSNRLLSPIVFTVDEMYALYFAMLTLNDYQTTPFHLSTVALKHKFEMCLSDDKKSHLRKMEAILNMSGIKHFNESNFLKEILSYAIESQVCSVEYEKQSKIQTYTVQFFDISSSFGQWYTTAFNFQTNRPIVFRCDRINYVSPSTKYQAKELSTLTKPTVEMFKKADAIDFTVEVTEKGVDLFRKENYPSMNLEMKNGSYFITGFYNQEEVSFITRYFLSYGDQILSIKPIELKKGLLEKLRDLENHFLKII